MLGNLTGAHLVIILVIIILIFGAAKLPALAKSVGQSMKIFKNEIKSETPPAKDAPELNKTSPEVQAQVDSPERRNP